MKTRSSSGVGQKVDLGYNVDTLRITDLGEDEYDSPSSTPGSKVGAAVIDKVKRSGATKKDDDRDPDEGSAAPKIKGETDSTMLRNFLNTLGDDDD